MTSLARTFHLYNFLQWVELEKVYSEGTITARSVQINKDDWYNIILWIFYGDNFEFIRIILNLPGYL